MSGPAPLPYAPARIPRGEARRRRHATVGSGGRRQLGPDGGRGGRRVRRGRRRGRREAARAGAEVLVLERAGGWGRAAALPGGFISLGGGTALQRACGFDDSPEAIATFLMATMGLGAVAAKISAYGEGTAGGGPPCHYRRRCHAFEGRPAGSRP
ncbi:hypothetical protein ACFVT2_34630 [Streptomyces sp. NPDC058000]|uniref:hypothetical protein n=1 Tax=Streptomyces sp. NPDC058000 TaxID=3346299 RepID=UPI0036F0A263